MSAGNRQRVRRCQSRFKRFYPGGFHDDDYVALERLYKWEAHQRWNRSLGRTQLRSMLDAGEVEEIARTAVGIESRTNLLFSFEKMALRDAIKSQSGAEIFSNGISDWLYGGGSEKARFERWCNVVDKLPRCQTRVATWPVVTVFGFIARPRTHTFLKPNVTRAAADRYGFDFPYRSRPAWETYSALLQFAQTIRADLADWRPRDMIDIQSFIWVTGSAEYD